MAMSRKHFTAIALLLSEYLFSSNTREEAMLVASLTRSLAGEFGDANPRFDFEKFYAACGLDSEGFLPEVTPEDVAAAITAIQKVAR